MITVWRLVTARFAATAFSGEGARLYGGRWNRKGAPMIYTAASQSLAMLEILVQDEPLRARYVMIPATLPRRLKREQIALADLPANWQDPAARAHLQTLGADWLKRSSSAVLAVPSAVIPDELNYLLNPQHPDFSKIEIGAARAFVTDLRLLRPQ
ncbi:MAG: RES domain-containing protein [Rhodocyclaceae bacterium]|nr:RES domain-containing protein [Rhodocyclaceae bacterium]